VVNGKLEGLFAKMQRFSVFNDFLTWWGNVGACSRCRRFATELDWLRQGHSKTVQVHIFFKTFSSRRSDTRFFKNFLQHSSNQHLTKLVTVVYNHLLISFAYIGAKFRFVTKTYELTVCTNFQQSSNAVVLWCLKQT